MKKSVMLPGNTPGALNPVIPVETAPLYPVGISIKKRGMGFQNIVNGGISSAEDEKETDARKFPKLRGF